MPGLVFSLKWMIFREPCSSDNNLRPLSVGLTRSGACLKYFTKR